MHQQEKELHINVLKVKAVKLALNYFLVSVMGEALVLLDCNATVGLHLRKQGGTVPLTICRLILEIINRSELHMVSIYAMYISGKNILTDQLSHPDQVLPADWSGLLSV